MTKKERMQEYLRGYRERQEARVKLRRSYAAAETRTRRIVQPAFMGDVARGVMLMESIRGGE